MSKIHYVKTEPRYFSEVCSGNKKFEVRKNDRGYQVGDLLVLQEFVNGRYTGKGVLKQITYILDDPAFCKEGFVIMSIRPYVTTKSFPWSIDDVIEAIRRCCWLVDYFESDSPCDGCPLSGECPKIDFYEENAFFFEKITVALLEDIRENEKTR